MWPKGAIVGASVVALASALLSALPRVGNADPQVPGGRVATSQHFGVAVASEAPRASREAMRVLKSGGNAMDAAVTAALVAGVVSPSSSGIGGGAFISVWNAKKQRHTIIDAREVAPRGLEAEAFERRPFDAADRGRWVGVPGEVAGLSHLHREFGKKAWGELVEPAVRVAYEGFKVERHLARALGWLESSIRRDKGLSDLWLSSGKLPGYGQIVKNPALATTLQRIARSGPKAFYEGVVAAQIVASTRAAGGSLTMADLRQYRPKERKAIKVRYAGADVYMMPPPSAGGYLLAHALKLLPPEELRGLGYGTAAYQHVLAEAFRSAIADRMRHFGDPEKVDVPLERLLDDRRMREVRTQIELFKTRDIVEFSQNEHGTHHLVTADNEGNVVALTTTVNRGFGAKLTATGVGVVLNDELDDFTSNAAVAPFGMKQSPNRARPGARPVSSMSPTIVVDRGRAVFAAGGSGGMTIATNVAQAVLANLAFGISPSRFVNDRRFQVPTTGASLLLPQGATTQMKRDLTARGERVDKVRFGATAVQAVFLTESGWRAAADPRKFGLSLTGN